MSNLATSRALTLLQPWATYIAHFGKDVENRTWLTSWRGTLLIHAGRSIDESAPTPTQRIAIPTGAILAVARLADCHRGHPGCCVSPWAEPDAVHWVLEDVVALPAPVPCSGSQGLWRPAHTLIAQINTARPAQPSALIGGASWPA